MKVDVVRVRSYCTEIRRYSQELNQLVDTNELRADSVALKAAKYLLIELAEAMAQTLQHVLAREKGLAASGYIDGLVKAHESGIISEELFQRLKPFFDFRNTLIHRYWAVADHRIIEDIRHGRGDFDRFVEELEAYLSRQHG
mgnify:CR=1 FL=1